MLLLSNTARLKQIWKRWLGTGLLRETYRCCEYLLSPYLTLCFIFMCIFQQETYPPEIGFIEKLKRKPKLRTNIISLETLKHVCDIRNLRLNNVERVHESHIYKNKNWKNFHAVLFSWGWICIGNFQKRSWQKSACTCSFISILYGIKWASQHALLQLHRVPWTVDSINSRSW